MDNFANLLAAPIVLPLLGAALGLLVAPGTRPNKIPIQRALAIGATALNLVVAIWLLYATVVLDQRVVLQMGGWQAPFGITLVADGLSAIMLTLAGLLMVATVFFAMGTLDQREGMNFHPLLLFLLMGINIAFLAGDLFNLYVSFEVLLMASFVLLTLGGRPTQVSGGLRYVVLNLVASLIFLATVGVVYASLGTLNLAQLALRMELVSPALKTTLAGSLLIAYASKAGLFPLFFWLPSSYHTPHPAVTAVFGGLLTKVGIYTLFRVNTLIFPDLLVAWQPLILTIAGLTMLVGVFGAMTMTTIRRVLSFQIISHVGFIVMGLGLTFSSNQLAVGFGLAAGIFYIIHHMILKTALLMAGGVAELEMGTGRLEAGFLGGLYKKRKLLTVIFFIAAFSLAGIPPASGFVSKLALLQSALDAHQWWIAAISLLVSLFTLMSMVRVWQFGFAGDAGVDRHAPSRLSGHRQWLAMVPIMALVLLSFYIGIFNASFFHWSSVAASQLIDRAGYIQAVNPVEGIPIIKADH